MSNVQIEIPSPTVFLQRSPLIKPAPPPSIQKKAIKARTTSGANASKQPFSAVKGAQIAGGDKPKQSKSRNGCMTCKKKRLKCDEVKPGCQQCQKRGVVCEGYKKDFKWRTFEETTFTSKPMARAKKAAVPMTTEPASASVSKARSPQDTVEEPRWTPVGVGLGGSSPDYQARLPPLSSFSNGSTPSFTFDGQLSPANASQMDSDLSFDASFPGPSSYSPPYSDAFAPVMVSSTVSGSSQNENTSPRASISTFSSGSPQLLDLLLPGTDLNQPPDASELRPPMSPLPYQPTAVPIGLTLVTDIPVEEDFDEEIVRQPVSGVEATSGPSSNSWSFRTTSPAPSDSSTSSKSSDLTIYAQPQFQVSSPELLTMRFDKQTCGILSIKDGPTENPWRTLVWPLAQHSPALYHAISSMTAFHGSNEHPEMRMTGMAHMTKSIKHLASEIANMSLDAALATSLALAFSEGWDEHVSTGIRHLKGAKFMVNNAVTKYRDDRQLGLLNSQDAMRLKFLCNTFVYMDVIARLTSLEEDHDINFEEIIDAVQMPFGDLLEVDPLMGCATTLFPLIGRAANLIQKVRKTESNSLALVSQAMELKQAIQQWQIPSHFMFEKPEDPNSEVQHSIQTAEAYRCAILLYLHQAVPEIPSETDAELSKRILLAIAGVPLSSRATIVQIFPLLAASCEATTQDDREWVISRWLAMISRLKIGNVDSCFNVVQEVWRRRDLFEAEKADRFLRRQNSRVVPSGNFVPPLLGNNKRKAYTTEAMDQDAFFSGLDSNENTLVDRQGRRLKRRLTYDAVGMSMPTGLMSPPMHSGAPGRNSDLPMQNFEPEYTVRGRLHWIGVMTDWDWEVFPG